MQNNPLKNYTRVIKLPLMIPKIKIFQFSSFRSRGMLFPFGYLLEWILLMTWSLQEWVGAPRFSAEWVSVLNSKFKFLNWKSKFLNSNLNLKLKGIRVWSSFFPSIHDNAKAGGSQEIWSGNSSLGFSLYFLLVSCPTLNSKCITFRASGPLCVPTCPCLAQRIHPCPPLPSREK